MPRAMRRRTVSHRRRAVMARTLPLDSSRIVMWNIAAKNTRGGGSDGGSFCSGRAGRASGGQLPQGALGRSDRQPARVVRFRRLCLSRRADRDKILPEHRSDRLAARCVCGLWRRLPGAAARRHRDRPPRRHQRPQDGAGAHHLPDGVRHGRHRPVALL